MDEFIDIVEAITKRSSIRSFKKKAVPKDILRKIIEISCRSPSSVNQQPWEFTVVTGDVLNEIRKLNVESVIQGIPSQRDFSSVERPEESVYRKRQVELAKQIFTIMDIRRHDKEKRREWLLRGFRYFDAPCAIIISTDRSLKGDGTLFDIGAVMQTICLSALKFGLGTCIVNQGIQYPDMLRTQLGIPENKRIAVCLAIGYPDWDFSLNQMVTARESIDNITTWHGFE